VFIDEDIWRHVDMQNGYNQCLILANCDSTIVVNLSAQVIQYLKKDFLIFIQQHFQLSLADCEVFDGEFVQDTPTNCIEFSSVLENGVEEPETKE
jgi:hypothetical protein